MIESSTHAGIVLCGGHSSRMGRPKMSLPIGDETMLQRVVRLLSKVNSQVLVVAAANQELPQLDPQIAVARDVHPDAGPLAGIAAGLQALPASTSAAFITSCDVPLLQPRLVAHLLSLADTADIVIPVDERHHHTLTAVYRRDIGEVAERLLSDGQRRPFSLLEDQRVRRVSMEECRRFDPHLDSFRNLNTPQDFQAALQEIAARPELA